MSAASDKPEQQVYVQYCEGCGVESIGFVHDDNCDICGHELKELKKYLLGMPLIIYEWCALTQEMLDLAYPRDVFPYDIGWLKEIDEALKFFLRLDPDAIERGKVTLRQRDGR